MLRRITRRPRHWKLTGGALYLLTAAAESSRVIGYPQENEIRIMTLHKICILLSLLAGLLVAVSCNHGVSKEGNVLREP